MQFDLHLNAIGQASLAKDFIKLFYDVECDLIQVDPLHMISLEAEKIEVYLFPQKDYEEFKGHLEMTALVYSEKQNMAFIYSRVGAFCHAGFPGLTTTHITPDFVSHVLSTKDKGRGFKIERDEEEHQLITVTTLR